MFRMDMTPDQIMIGELGEIGVLARLQSYCPAGVVGDDAALLDPGVGKLVITTDVLVDEVHFSQTTTPPESVGWRAAAANLSDLAAMGARPFALVIGLGLPGSTPLDWVERLYQGIQACCQPWQTDLVGGDLCRSKHRFVSITALGRVAAERAIWRHQARPGDWLLVSGPHGSSRAGLEILLHPERGSHLSPTAQAELIRAHQFPNPRLDLIPYFEQLDPWLGSQRLAGMDTSDGLADALVQICAASGVNAVVKPEWIPQSPALREGFPDTALDWALYGGEDFELLISLPPAAAEHLIQQSTSPIHLIGYVTSLSGDQESHVDLEGIGILQRENAFQHFT